MLSPYEIHFSLLLAFYLITVMQAQSSSSSLSIDRILSMKRVRDKKITTPTLWMGGAVDWNVPIMNSEQMYLGMKALGRETQLVVYPGEHHGIRRPSFQRDRLERYLAWFEQYLNEAS